MPEGIYSPTDPSTQKPAPPAYAPCPVCSNGVVTEAQLAGFNRLLEIETKAIEQSEYIQLNGLTEFERTRLENEVRGLTARITELEATLAASKIERGQWVRVEGQ